jgi:hypothetical protein
MGTDTPDWGGTYNDEQLFPLQDVGELAARTGSFVTYDRRGSMIWGLNFEHGFAGLDKTTVGAGSSVKMSADTWETGAFSVKLTCGAIAGNTAALSEPIPIPSSLVVGFQASVKLYPEVGKLYVNLRHYDGALNHYTYILVDLPNALLQIRTAEDGLLTLASDLANLGIGYYFAHFKVVCDLSTHKILRVLLDGVEYQLDDKTMPTVISVLTPQLLPLITVESDGTQAGIAYIDNYIITAAEPPNS